jgi:hypothetical protein
MKIKMLEEVFIEINGRWKTYKKGVTYRLEKSIAEKLLPKAEVEVK